MTVFGFDEHKLKRELNFTVTSKASGAIIENKNAVTIVADLKRCTISEIDSYVTGLTETIGEVNQMIMASRLENDTPKFYPAFLYFDTQNNRIVVTVLESPGSAMDYYVGSTGASDWKLEGQLTVVIAE